MKKPRVLLRLAALAMGLCLLAGVGAVAAFAVLTAAGFVLMLAPRCSP